MAGISLTYTTPNINPTANYLPINNGTANFGDSVIYGGSNRLVTKPGGVTKGFSLDFGSNVYLLGDTNSFSIGTGVPTAFALAGTGLTSGSAGGVSGQHLIFTINGTIYKIALNLP